MGREKPTDSGKVINILERCAPKSSKREKWAHKPQVPAHSQSHMDKRYQAELFRAFLFREPGDQKVFPLLSAFDFPGKPPPRPRLCRSRSRRSGGACTSAGLSSLSPIELCCRCCRRRS